MLSSQSYLLPSCQDIQLFGVCQCLLADQTAWRTSLGERLRVWLLCTVLPAGVPSDPGTGTGMFYLSIENVMDKSRYINDKAIQEISGVQAAVIWYMNSCPQITVASAMGVCKVQELLESAGYFAVCFAYEVSGAIIQAVVPILQVRKLRLREVQQPAQHPSSGL